MSKVKKGKRVIAAAMAVALSMATVTTGVLPNSGILVRAAETNKKLADSSVDGFYYQNDQCIYIISRIELMYTHLMMKQSKILELWQKKFIWKINMINLQ